MKKKNRKNKSILLRIMVLGVGVYMIATLYGLWNTLNENKKELNALKAQQAATQTDIDELRAVLADGSEKKMIEKAARERLGYVYEGDLKLLCSLQSDKLLREKLRA